MTSRSVLALLLCLAVPIPAMAQSPIPIQRMVCADAMALVKREGAVLLAVGGSTFERFVRDRSFCDVTEVAELRFVRTRDNPECPVGYRCRELGVNDWDWQ